eukprot:TRINITY_DN5586_c0_g1_i1.p1 TRINITY_DN5586_c0_g1~~TRINITY_DN5586_c0_g1_i1.p1  ORF type:complete len:266 (-),score=15.35 TRINITY_DN5586_c0_g1_i1:56-853(-)
MFPNLSPQCHPTNLSFTPVHLKLENFRCPTYYKQLSGGKKLSLVQCSYTSGIQQTNIQQQGDNGGRNLPPKHFKFTGGDGEGDDNLQQEEIEAILVKKGKKMAGHLGAARVTVRSLDVVQIDNERGLLLVKGPVPGHNQAMVQIRPSVRLYKSKGAQVPEEKFRGLVNARGVRLVSLRYRRARTNRAAQAAGQPSRISADPRPARQDGPQAIGGGATRVGEMRRSMRDSRSSGVGEARRQQRIRNGRTRLQHGRTQKIEKKIQEK